MKIAFEYTVKKEISIKHIADYTLTRAEIETEIERLHIEHCPKDYKILESSWSFECDNREPFARGCELNPPTNCWIDINEIQWATNGLCTVTPECPAINSNNNFEPWLSGFHAQSSVTMLLNTEQHNNILHTGIFDKRFLSLKEIPNLQVFGEGVLYPGYCYVENQLIAIIMPTEMTKQFQNKALFLNEVFQFHK